MRKARRQAAYLFAMQAGAGHRKPVVSITTVTAIFFKTFRRRLLLTSSALFQYDPKGEASVPKGSRRPEVTPRQK